CRRYGFFFFQAEDGIRDWSVTGVQTCALPISPTDAEIDKQAREQFDAIDTNKDGKLSREELQTAQRNRVRGSRVVDSFDQYDKNKDGSIDFEEYKQYVKDRANRNRGGGDSNNPAAAARPEEGKRPLVYRIGKLPKDLPPWFTQLDTDLDGQVGLYEWKKAGKEVAEFLAMDINGDGFVTVEELLRWQKAQKKVQDSKNGVGSAAAGGQPAPGAAPAAGGPPAGGQGPQRFGK